MKYIHQHNDFSLFVNLNNGYMNDKQLYFKEQPDFKTIISCIEKFFK